MKRLIVLTALIQLYIVIEAKEISSKEGVDVLGTKENTINSTEFRDKTISQTLQVTL